MKKLLLFAICIFTLASCKNEKTAPGLPEISENDSLQKIIEQKDNEINDMMGIFNEIEEGFRLINKEENKISLAKDGEAEDQAERIRESMKSIQELMAKNRELIDKLQSQLRESSINGDQMKRTIENLTKQLTEKDNELQDLRAQLEEKDIHIAELDQAVSTLNQNVSDLKTENENKTNTINTQDKELNTAWYVYGTKSELKEQNILVKGKVLQSNFNKNYFKKIDIRVDKEIKLYSKSAEILTTHPSSSYTLSTDSQKQYVLRITNPDLFWSTSKYLVVQVK